MASSQTSYFPYIPIVSFTHGSREAGEPPTACVQKEGRAGPGRMARGVHQASLGSSPSSQPHNPVSPIPKRALQKSLLPYYPSDPVCPAAAPNT